MPLVVPAPSVNDVPGSMNTTPVPVAAILPLEPFVTELSLETTSCTPVARFSAPSLVRAAFVALKLVPVLTCSVPVFVRLPWRLR